MSKGPFVYDPTSDWTRNQQYEAWKVSNVINFQRILKNFDPTTGDLSPLGTTNKFIIGAQANTAGSGTALTASLPGVLRVFSDDGGASLDAADSVRGVQSRLLLTVDQSGSTIRALQGQLKCANGVDFAAGVYTALQAYVELAGTHAVNATGSAAKFSCADVSLEIHTALTVAIGAYAFGVHVETTGAGTITNNGTCAAIGIDKASGAADWPVGLLVANTTTGVSIGAATTGLAITGDTTNAIQISGDAVNAINITNDCTPSGSGLLIAGAAATPINITGQFTTGITIAADGTTAISVTNAFTGTTGMSFAGTAINGIVISGACSGDAIQISGDATNAINITSGCSPTGAGLLIAGAAATGVSITGATTNGIAISGAPSTAAINITGAEAIGLLIATSTPTSGISITAACANAIAISGSNTTAGISISGDQVLGTLFATTAAADAAHRVTIPTGITLGAGLDINATSTGTVTSGLTMQGTGTFTTGITLSASAITTGIRISAGAMTDAIKISGTTPVDGIEISSACSANAINLSGSSAIGLMIAPGVTQPVSVGTKANVKGSGVVIPATDDWGAVRVFTDDNGANIGQSVRGLQSRTLLTFDQSAGSIRALQGQMKLLTNIDVASGVYTAVQGYVEMAGTHACSNGAVLSCFDASTEITTALTVASGGRFYGVHVETTGAGTITNNGTCAAIGIDKASGAADWPMGLYVANSKQAIEANCTLAPSGRLAKMVGGVTNPGNLGDGYGFIEHEIDVSGTAVAGQFAASSTWINFNASSTAGTNTVSVRDDGIWSSATGTPLANAKCIIGGRMQFVVVGGGNPGSLYLWATNIYDNALTALFDINTILDFSVAGGAGSAGGTKMPFLKERSTGKVYYINLYTS